MYDPIFRLHFGNSTFKLKNCTVGFHETNPEYDNMYSVTSYSKKNMNESDVVFLFTQQDVFFEKILGDQHLVLKYGVSLFNMVSDKVLFKMD